MKSRTDIFEALPEELEIYPDSMTEVQTPRSSPPEDTRSPIAPTRRNDPRTTRVVNAPPSSADDDDDEEMDGTAAPPPSREMLPPRVPAAKRVTTREDTRLPHQDGEVLSVTGRSKFANETKMPQE